MKLLAFNDFHGHLEAGRRARSTIRSPGRRVLAGGAEYFATHLKALGSESVDTYVVSAGDLIGASPLASGLMHDEPTIDVMNYVGLDTIGVGNHEFDEGKAELLRMQYGNRPGGGGRTAAPPTCRLGPTAATRSTAARTARRSTAPSSSTSRRT